MADFTKTFTPTLPQDVILRIPRGLRQLPWSPGKSVTEVGIRLLERKVRFPCSTMGTVAA